MATVWAGSAVTGKVVLTGNITMFSLGLLVQPGHNPQTDPGISASRLVNISHHLVFCLAAGF